jgi:hypothetical protein
VRVLGSLDLCLEFGRQLALLGDGGQHGGAAFVQRLQRRQRGHDRGDLLLVQPAGGLLAVAGDEGQRVAGGEQVDGGRHLVPGQVELAGDFLSVGVVHR